MDFKPKRHNRPIAKLIKDFENKKSGRVTESRKEIMHRFDHLDWSQQKKIIHLFLVSGKADRVWASRKIYDYWDDSFMPVVKDLWERLNEERLAWVIIKFFPKDYLKQNFSKLDVGRNYYFLCLRLFGDKDFVLDESRLMEHEVLKVFCSGKEPISDEKARDLLYTLIYKMCVGIYDYDKMRISVLYDYQIKENIGGDYVCLMASNVISSILDSLYKLGKSDIVNGFFDWNQEVMTEIFCNKQYLVPKHTPYTIDEMMFMFGVLRNICYSHLYSKYKHENDTIDCKLPQEPIIDKSSETKKHEPTQEEREQAYADYEEMREKYPAMDNVINTFDLELPF